MPEMNPRQRMELVRILSGLPDDYSDPGMAYDPDMMHLTAGGMPQSRPQRPALPPSSPYYNPNEPSFRLPEDLTDPNNPTSEETLWQELIARSQERGVTLPHSGTPEAWERFMNEFWEHGGSDSDGQLLDFFSKYLGGRTPWHRDFSLPPSQEPPEGQQFGPSGRPRPRPYRPRQRFYNCPPEPTS